MEVKYDFVTRKSLFACRMQTVVVKIEAIYQEAIIYFLLTTFSIEIFRLFSLILNIELDVLHIDFINFVHFTVCLN